MTPGARTPAERLAFVHDELAELAAVAIRDAQAGHEPHEWARWSDLSAALMAVRAAQGRAAREAPTYTPAEWIGSTRSRREG